MEQGYYQSSPHRRFNQLTGEWILVSPQRSLRPWGGQEEAPDTTVHTSYDPTCYLCPGNKRAAGAVNPNYTDTFVFTNDFAALLPRSETCFKQDSVDTLLKAEPESGICRVVCYSPRHDLTMARMEPTLIEQIVSTWQKEYTELGSDSRINYVQIFENRGQVMGCSNPHPHGQIWASGSIPTIPAVETQQQDIYLKTSGSCLLCSYLEMELQQQERILFRNSSFVALVPFWAVWPFETMILPRRHCSSIPEITQQEKHDLADIIKSLGTCYDNLFQTSFPYSMGIHQQPTDGTVHDYWHFHLHYLPPLLRSQTVKKHMVGYELLAMTQRDITAETAAQRLRELPLDHYLAS